MIRHSLLDSQRSEPGPACAVSSGSPFLPLSPVCCPASSTAACPHLFSCLLFLSHLIASSLCSSGFAFWILLLSSRATVSVSLPRSLLYSCPLSPCPASSRALICVLVLLIAYRPCAPHSSHISNLLPWELCPAWEQGPSGFFQPSALTVSAYLLLPSAWVSAPWAANPSFFFTSFLQLWEFGSPLPYS